MVVASHVCHVVEDSVYKWVVWFDNALYTCLATVSTVQTALALATVAWLCGMGGGV